MASYPTNKTAKPFPPFFSLESDDPLPVIETPWKAKISLADTQSVEKSSQQDAGESVRLSITTEHGKIWLEGNSLFCACPRCAAPLSIRMWLLTADCWQCETRIQLTKEQEESVAKLLKSRPAETRSPQPQESTAPAPAPEPERI